MPSPSSPSLPTIAIKTLTDADTEYSYTFPNGTKQFELQARTAVAVRFAFVTGKVATPTDPYATIKSGQAYQSALLWGGQSLTVYLASAGTGTVVEIVSWT